MKRKHSYKDLQTGCDNETFANYIGSKMEKDDILEEFKNSRFCSDGMKYEVTFDSDCKSRFQPTFVITETKDQKYKMANFYGIGGFVWMSPSIFSIVRSRLQDSLAVLTQSKADKVKDGKSSESLIIKLMNYKYDLEELEKKKQRLEDEAMLNEEEDDDDEEEEEEEEGNEDSNNK